MIDSAKNHVLIVGVGGLGAPAASALVREGVRKIVLIDPEPVELSNLPRQVLYGASDIGTPKAAAASRRLKAIRPELEIETYDCELNPANAPEIISRSGFVIDATDNPAAKFLI